MDGPVGARAGSLSRAVAEAKGAFEPTGSLCTCLRQNYRRNTINKGDDCLKKKGDISR